MPPFKTALMQALRLEFERSMLPEELRALRVVPGARQQRIVITGGWMKPEDRSRA